MKPSRRRLRIASIAVAAVLVIAAGIGAVAIANFDPNAYKPQIIEAVKRATGRTLALNGKIGLKPSLWPTIQVADAAFSNPPGFSRPELATLQGLELQLGLLPLLSSRIEINRLVLIHPDILLETDSAGHSNWQLTPEVSPSAPGAAQAPVTSGKTSTAVSVESIRIQDGTVGYRDGATGKVTTLALAKLEAKAASPDSPLHVEADAGYNGTAVSLIADTGSLSRLQDPAATSAWPVKMVLTAAGAKLAVDGALTQPLRGKGYDLAVSGTVPDASALTPLLQGFVLPPLHDVSFAAKVADTGGKIPAFSALTLHAGASDLSAQYPGLALDKLDVTADAAGQPVKADAAGKVGDQAFAFVATSGPLAGLMPGAKPAPFPVDVTFRAGGATMSAKGTIADAQAMTGASIVLAAQIPDLSGLSPLARRPLPALKQIELKATLADAPGGFRHGAALHALSLTSAGGDISGDATIGLGARNSLVAALKSSRIDLDALQTAIDQMPAATPPPAQAGAKPPSPPLAAAGDKPPPKRSERLFSDDPIPFDGLRTADADVKLNIAGLHSGGADYKAIDSHLLLKDGRLSVDPFAADLPGGHLAGNLFADATQAAPSIHVTLHAPGLALKTILAAVHEPAFASGNLEVYADLHGTGVSPHAIASSLDGSLGLAMAGGTIDNRLLGSLLGKVMDTLNAMDLAGKGGTSEVKCFGVRMDAEHGIGAFKALALSSSLLTMTGGGAVNLGDETLALQLRPRARVAGTAVVIPLAVSGPIRNPAVKVNEIAAAESNAGTVAGAVIGNATPLGIVGGLLGGNKMLGGAGIKALGGDTTDICPPVLAAARGQATGGQAPGGQPAGGQGAGGQAVPDAAPGAKPAAPAAPNPGAALKKLFR
jgi:AsmA protein